MNERGVIRPEAPRRPLWVILLTGLMLCAAFLLGLRGLSMLTANPSQPPQLGTALAVTLEEAALRAVALAAFQAQMQHLGITRVWAVFQLALAGFVFFAVAAVLSSNRRARLLAILAASSGLLYHPLDAVYGLYVLRPAIVARAPEVARQISQNGAVSADAMVPIIAEAASAWPIRAAIVGMLLSAVVLMFFAGRRGRAWFGRAVC